MEFINQIYINLIAGDVFALLMVISAFIIVFFILKIILNAVKALFIVAAILLIAAFLMPDAKILEKTQDAGQQAVDYMKHSLIPPEN